MGFRALPNKRLAIWNPQGLYSQALLANVGFRRLLPVENRRQRSAAVGGKVSVGSFFIVLGQLIILPLGKQKIRICDIICRSF